MYLLGVESRSISVFQLPLPDSYPPLATGTPPRVSLAFPGYTTRSFPSSHQAASGESFIFFIIIRLIPCGHLLTLLFCPRRSLFLLLPTPALYSQPPLNLTTSTTTTCGPPSLSLSLSLSITTLKSQNVHC